MNTIVIKRGINQIATNLSPVKLLGVAAILVLISLNDFGEIVIGLLAEAYLQVSVFVAATLAGLFFFEKIRRAELESFLLNNPRLQIPVAAMLGALPGCGGALVVTTQYMRGSISFSGVVAVLASTMGDAAFLLLAREPLTAMVVFSTCLVAGVVSGWVVDRIHGPDFMRVKYDRAACEQIFEEVELLTPLYKLWLAMFVPGAFFGLSIAFQADPNSWMEKLIGYDFVEFLAIFAALLSVIMWALNPLSDMRLYTSRHRTISRRIVDTTNFVTFWVIVGYISYGLLEYLGFDLKSLFTGWSFALPLFGLLVGFIPGCGPQIVVTSLYLSGNLPLSALLANAISNDGDALFPTIAVAPKAALLATVYTAVPAIIVGYGYYFLFE